MAWPWPEAREVGRRLVHHYAITGRLNGPLDIVAPGDFELSLRATSETPYLPPGALAYCADLARERVLFTCHAQHDLPALFAGPFLYVEQLRAAGSVISVPFERLHELAPPKAAAAPVFIFSPGRAGTTLLSTLLAAAGLPSASEPDMLTQAACLTAAQLQPLPPGADRMLAAICIESLARVLGPGAFLKLRSQCNARPLALVEAAPGCRVIFVLRKAMGWAMSRKRAFNEPPNHIAMLLYQALEAHHQMVRAQVNIDVLWFETLVSDPLAALRLCAPDARPDPTRIAAAMARDSQSGSILAQSGLAPAEIDHAYFNEFEAQWHGVQATAPWTPRTWILRDEMWETPRK
jgi:hypothetical protein